MTAFFFEESRRRNTKFNGKNVIIKGRKEWVGWQVDLSIYCFPNYSPTNQPTQRVE
jgi:hypothetical protein